MPQNLNIYQCAMIGLTGVILILSSASFVALAQPAEMPLIGLNISGTGMAQTLGDTDVNVGQAEISISLLTLTAGYKATYYDTWNTFANLSAGQTSKAKTLTVEEFSLGGLYGGEITDRWSYFALAAGSRAAERDAADAYWNGVLGGAAAYALSEHWNLLGGVAALYTNAPLTGSLTEKFDIDQKLLVLPVLGVQWNQQAESGFAVSVIFPMEAKLSYASADQKLTSYIDALTTAAEVQYQFTPRFNATVYAQLLDQQIHRLASDNLILPENTSEAYLQTERNRMELMFGTTFFEHVALQAGPYYLFNSETSVLKRNGDTLREFDNDDAFGGKFALAITF